MSQQPAKLAPKFRLRGKAIFLSASVPKENRDPKYLKIPDAAIQIEQAVISVAQAIFIEGGTLVFGAHPSISPLVARVVEGYHRPAPAEAGTGGSTERVNSSVEMFQSKVWKEQWADANELFSRNRQVRLHWIDQEPGESINLEIKDKPQAPLSMEKMREAMIERTKPVAMIAIGGMDGVVDEARCFAELRQGKPIFAFVTTGGAAALLPTTPGLRDWVKIADGDGEKRVSEFWKQDHNKASARRLGEDEKYYVPYAVFAQEVVEGIVRANLG